MDGEDEHSEEIRHLLQAFECDGVCETLELSSLDLMDMALFNPPPSPVPVIAATPINAVEPKPERLDAGASGRDAGNTQSHFGVAAAYDGVAGAVVLVPVAHATDGDGGWAGVAASLGDVVETPTPTLLMVDGNDNNNIIDVTVNDVVPCVVPVPDWVLVTNRELLDCSNCTRFREVVDLNDMITMKMEVHGDNNCFSHATVDMVDSSNVDSRILYVADFRGYAMSAIKQFLDDYCLTRRHHGFILISDSSSHMYAALCAYPEYNNNSGTALNPLPQDPPPSSAAPSIQPVAPMMASSIATNLTQGREKAPAFKYQKTGIALQRERTGSLKLEDLAPCFHLPITDAATRLNLCTTALKKVCRRNGIARWPYRKVKSTDSAIAKLLTPRGRASGKGTAAPTAASITRFSGARRQAAAVPGKVRAEINRLRDERAKACEGWEGRLRRCEAEIRQLTERLRGESGDQADATRASIEELHKVAAECQAKSAAMRSKRLEDDNN